MTDWAKVKEWGAAITDMAENAENNDEKPEVAKDWIAMYARTILDLVRK